MRLCSLQRWLLLVSVTLTSSACNLSLYETYELGVPYRAQVQRDYCVPASILMWRLYDRLSEIPQRDIYNYLGGQACSPFDVPDGVNHFTNTFDSYFDVVFSPLQQDREELIARQITSEDRGVPVIAIVGDARNHVGVINGGKYSRKGSYYQWDFLFFHDPARGEGLYYASSDWLEHFCSATHSYCGQILSSNAATGWKDYYAYYRNSILLYGGGGEACTPRTCGPIEY
jgi:hypothetical protein